MGNGLYFCWVADSVLCVHAVHSSAYENIMEQYIEA